MTTAALHIDQHGLPTKRVTYRQIQRAVCQYFKISEDELLGPRCFRVVARPRQIAMFLTRKHTQLSFPAIADRFGQRHHTTVMHACEVMAERVASDDPSWHLDVVSIESDMGIFNGQG
jgi:chromosomal replication initiator protein